jgi:pimeloyl-[acyl-carrier protein] methyl ester esterase
MDAKPKRWILIRGLGREAAHWGEFRERFQSAFPGCEVSALDLPGAGSRCLEKAPLRLSSFVSCLREEAGGEGAVGLVALSLGAMVALEWAALFPQSVSHLVAMSTSLGSQAFPWERFTPEAIFRGVNVAFARGGQAREQAILDLTSNSEMKRKEALAEWTRIAEERPVSLVNYLRQMTAALHAAPDLKRIRAKGLVLASRGDRLVKLSCSEKLARKMGWKLAVHGSAGHDLPLDDPEWCVERIREWMAT